MKRFLREEKATSTVEYIILGALLTAIIVPILVAIFNTLSTKLEDINDGL